MSYREVTGNNFVGYNQGINPLVKYNYFLRVEALFDIPLKRVQAFARELEYEYIQEGGLNDYVHIRRKPKSKPNTLVIERYAGTYLVDPLPNGAELFLPLILLVFRDTWVPARTYTFTGCTVIRKTYGELAAEDSGLLVDEIEIAYREFAILDIGLDLPIHLGHNYKKELEAASQTLRLGRETEVVKGSDANDKKFVVPAGLTSSVTAAQLARNTALQPLYKEKYGKLPASADGVKAAQLAQTDKKYNEPKFTTATSQGVQKQQTEARKNGKKYTVKTGNTWNEIKMKQAGAYKAASKDHYKLVKGNTVKEISAAQKERQAQAAIYKKQKGNTVKEIALKQKGLRFTDRRYTDLAVSTASGVAEQQEKTHKKRKKYVLAKGNTVNEVKGKQAVAQAKAKLYRDMNGPQESEPPEALGRKDGNTAAEIRAQQQGLPIKAYTVHPNSVDAIRQKQEELRDKIKKYDQHK